MKKKIFALLFFAFVFITPHVFSQYEVSSNVNVTVDDDHWVPSLPNSIQFRAKSASSSSVVIALKNNTYAKIGFYGTKQSKYTFSYPTIFPKTLQRILFFTDSERKIDPPITVCITEEITMQYSFILSGIDTTSSKTITVVFNIYSDGNPKGDFDKLNRITLNITFPTKANISKSSNNTESDKVKIDDKKSILASGTDNKTIVENPSNNNKEEQQKVNTVTCIDDITKIYPSYNSDHDAFTEILENCNNIITEIKSKNSLNANEIKDFQNRNDNNNAKFKLIQGNPEVYANLNKYYNCPKYQSLIIAKKSITNLRDTIVTKINKIIFMLVPGLPEECAKIVSKYTTNFSKYDTIIKNLKIKVENININFNELTYNDKFTETDRTNLLNELADDSILLIKNQAGFDSIKKLCVDALHNNDDFKLFPMDYSSLTVIDSTDKKIKEINENIPLYSYTIRDRVPKKTPVLIYIIIAIAAVLISFAGFVYLKAYRKKLLKASKSSTVTEQNGDIVVKEKDKSKGGIVITAKKTIVENGIGLDVVREKSGIEYYEINMLEHWKDSMVKKIFFHTTLINKIYEFFSKSLGKQDDVTETGGYIIGSWDFNIEDKTKYDISLEDFIEPGDDANYGEYQLNFGAKIMY